MKMIITAVDRGLITVASELGTKIVLQPKRDNPGICIMIWTAHERSMLTCAMTIGPTLDKAEIGDQEHEVALRTVACQMNWTGILSDGWVKKTGEDLMEGMIVAIRATRDMIGSRQKCNRRVIETDSMLQAYR